MVDTDAHISWQPPLGPSGDQLMMAHAREAERRSLARELHDTVIQPLTSLMVSFSCFERQLPAADATHAQLSLWRGLTQEALDALRAALAGFRPPMHDGGGLPQALQRFLAPQLGSRGL